MIFIPVALLVARGVANLERPGQCAPGVDPGTDSLSLIQKTMTLKIGFRANAVPELPPVPVVGHPDKYHSEGQRQEEEGAKFQVSKQDVKRSPSGPPQFNRISDEGTYRRYLIPFVLAFCVICLPVLYIHVVYKRGPDTEAQTCKVIRAHMFLASFVSTLNMMIITPFSFQLSVAVGQDASFSGLLIGIYMAASGPGSVLMWSLQRAFGHLWWQHIRTVLNVAFLISTAGTLGFLVVAYAAHYGVANAAWDGLPLLRVSLPWLLLSMRALSGLGDGLASQFIFSSFPRFTPDVDIPDAMIQAYFVNMLGIGLAPMFAELANVIVPHRHDGFAVVAAFQLAVVLGQSASFFTGCPSFKSMPTSKETAERHVAKPASSSLQHALLVACLVLVVIRNYSVSGLEVATTLLLETMYTWHHPWIGLAVGAVYLTVIPLKFSLDCVGHRLRRVNLIRVGTCSMLPGCMLLFQRSSVMLLFADALILPGMYMAHALVAGIRMQHAMEESVIFNIDSLALLGNCILPAVGRFLGPWVSRSLIQRGSQALYAASQVAVVLAYLFAFEVGVAAICSRHRVALVEIDDPKHKFGGTDKTSEGLRYDSVPIVHGLLHAGLNCELLKYKPQEHDKFFGALRSFDCVLFRCNPTDIAAAGVDRNRLDEANRELLEEGIWVFPSPQMCKNIGSKDALTKLSASDFGLPDTYIYRTPAEFEDGFRKTVAHSPRVVKQNRGSNGQGIWITKLRDGGCSSSRGKQLCSDDDYLTLTEAADGHVEEHTFAEFVDFCINGQAGAGLWHTTSKGGYLRADGDVDDALIDMRFLDRVAEGEVRFIMLADKVAQIETWKGLMVTRHALDAQEFADLKAKFEGEISALKSMLDVQSLPLLWTADFIAIEEHTFPFVVTEFNATCPGIGQYWPAHGRDLSLIGGQDDADGQFLCDMIGRKVASILKSGKPAS